MNVSKNMNIVFLNKMFAEYSIDAIFTYTLGGVIHTIKIKILWN